MTRKNNDLRLIESWLPIAALSEESIRERRSMTSLPPTYYLHVWWARRPLVASRAAILASLLPADADRAKFMHAVGIHGDPVAAKQKIAAAKLTVDSITGERKNLGPNIYGYDRAFKYSLNDLDRAWLAPHTQDITVLDPTAGGGSIPLEALRLETRSYANDLNPVAWFVLQSGIQAPAKFGPELIARFAELSAKFRHIAPKRFARIFHEEPQGTIVDGYLWARTVTCPACGAVVPLSPNWRLNNNGSGVKLVPQTKPRRIRFEIVSKAKDQSPGTVKGGVGLCPFPDCKSTIAGDDIKAQAQAGKMGHQLYAIVYKAPKVSGKGRAKMERGYRAPRPEDENLDVVEQALREKMPEWQARNIVPDEAYPLDANEQRPIQYGMPLWRDMFSPRQLYGHCTAVEIFHDMVDELGGPSGISDLDRAAMSYIAIAMDKLLNYNSTMSVWMPTREVVANTFNRHDFAFCWSYCEMAPTITGLGYDWAFTQTGKALSELVELIDGEQSDDMYSEAKKNTAQFHLSLGSADRLNIADATIDCVVMDPPYFDNVMYAELADYFYVWLKRTAGLLYPQAFQDTLTDKENEAVANAAKFRGRKLPKALATVDYQKRMADIFKECRRVLKKDGIMTLMFTHKASNAWDAIAKGLIEAGFVITASWPVHTEAESSLHIKEKAAAKSTIFLVCRPREANNEQRFWEDTEQEVRTAVKRRVEEFQAAGIRGVDLYLASFGPALQVVSSHWPLRRATALQKPARYDEEIFGAFDPYAVSPEDALDEARKEVKRWRLGQLLQVNRQAHFDALTEFYILALDAFGAFRFPADEALRLARVVGLDFDRDLKGKILGVTSGDVELWNSGNRARLAADNGAMIDLLHQAASVAGQKNIAAADKLLEKAGAKADANFRGALESLLRVLPPVRGGDFEIFSKIRAYSFGDTVPEVQKELFTASGEGEEPESEE